MGIKYRTYCVFVSAPALGETLSTMTCLLLHVCHPEQILHVADITIKHELPQPQNPLHPLHNAMCDPFYPLHLQHYRPQLQHAHLPRVGARTSRRSRRFDHETMVGGMNLSGPEYDRFHIAMFVVSVYIVEACSV